MIFVGCIMSCPEIFLSQGGVFQLSTDCTKTIFLDGWRHPLVNTSLIPQFRENVSSFNFLANIQFLLWRYTIFIFVNYIFKPSLKFIKLLFEAFFHSSHLNLFFVYYQISSSKFKNRIANQILQLDMMQVIMRY